jgi:glycerol uptake facilitator protein
MTLTRRKVAMVMAEFLGAALLVLIVLAVRYRSGVPTPYFIGLAAAAVLAASTFVFGRVSGAHLNPIVTIGMWSVRRVKTLPTIVYVAAQLLGAFVAYQLFTYLMDQKLTGIEAEFEGRVLVAEAAGAFVFCLGWAAAVYRRLNTAQAAAVVALSFFAGLMVASLASGNGIINPAVALGTKSWMWATYVLGPVLGAIIAFNLYSLLFAPTNELVREAEEERAEEAKAKPAKSSKKK